MVTFIRNKLKIIPKAYSEEDYTKQLDDVAKYCLSIEDGAVKNICFSKITPKPNHLKEESKEEDEWYLHNWGTRYKALNACWINDEEMIYDTFWNPSLPIIIKIIKTFPQTDFEFKFASKRAGTKTGKIIASKGKIISFERFKNFSKEAYETAFELMPHLRMLYSLNKQTNTYYYNTSDFDESIKQNGYYKDTDGSVLIGCDDKKKPLFNNIDDLPF